MTARDLVSARKQKGWSQEQAASKLGISQPYLSLLEKGERPITEELAHKAAKVYKLSLVSLPLKTNPEMLPPSNENELALALASLGYPGLSHLKSRRQKNPAEVLACALSVSNLDSRLTEALPWVVLRFPNLDWPWLVKTAKLNDLQNRLGYIINLARRIAEKRRETDKATLLARQEELLNRSRLAREDTLCHDALTQAEKRWLRNHRPEEARHWGLLTDLTPEHLSYGS